jgi:hypothetical protein
VVSCLLALVLLGTVGTRAIRNYVRVASTDFDLPSRLGRALGNYTSPGASICCISWDTFRISEPAVQFLAHGRNFNQLPADIGPQQAIEKCGTDKAIWAIHGRQSDLKELLKRNYPNGHVVDTGHQSTGNFFELFATTGSEKNITSN